MEQRKLNNKGFSMVELLVAMALAGIVAILVGSLMITSSKSYSVETARAELYNDIQFANTKLQKVLMEATTLHVETKESVTYVLTGEWDDAAGAWTSDSNPNGTAKAVIIYENHLYITDAYYTPDEVKAGNMKGYEVIDVIDKDTTFSVMIKNQVLDYASGVYDIEGPVVVEVQYQVASQKQTSKSSFDVVLRNSDVITKVYGTAYTKTDGVSVTGEINVK